MPPLGAVLISSTIRYLYSGVATCFAGFWPSSVSAGFFSPPFVLLMRLLTPSV